MHQIKKVFSEKMSEEENHLYPKNEPALSQSHVERAEVIVEERDQILFYSMAVDAKKRETPLCLKHSNLKKRKTS